MQSDGIAGEAQWDPKKSRLSSDRCKSGARRMTASPSLHVLAPKVFPVATNNDVPSVLIPPGAQMPPPRARVAHDLIVRGSEREMLTTNPRYWPQSPKCPPKAT